MKVISVNTLRDYLSFLPQLDLEAATTLPNHREEITKYITMDDRSIILNMTRDKDYIVAELNIVCYDCVVHIKFDIHNNIAYYEEVKYRR